MSETKNWGEYNVDICLCIDKTGSMSPIINTVKENALRLHEDITAAMAEKNKHIHRLRVRVIWFGDYLSDGSEAMLGSDFLVLPEEMNVFKDCVDCIDAYGGGDAPEDGLEALAFAMRSPWCQDGWKRRHIVCVFTDAPAHNIGYSSNASNYPHAMPASYEELMLRWGFEGVPGDMENAAKRLLLFAPDVSYWHRICREWENSILTKVNPDGGLSEISYRNMLDTITNSI